MLTDLSVTPISETLRRLSEGRASGDLQVRSGKTVKTVFFDHGRAWGGVNQNTVNGGWLSDVGIGLRLSFDRAAYGNILHADIAAPLDRGPGIKSVQYLVKTRISF